LLIVGVVGQSKEFMMRLIKRLASFHHTFNHGKMLAQARAQAKCDKNKLYVTSRACATCFRTSQYHNFLKLYDLLPSYIQINIP
jgi:ABC-type transporter Mla maintaining outer membrane lipid asymmetry ATPase subunit MlaF